MSRDTLPPYQGRRRYCRITDPEATSIFSRSKYYELAPLHPGLLLKLDGITIVDLDKRDEILASLPPAQIAPPRRKLHAR
jgi:hypothetical protein